MNDSLTHSLTHSLNQLINHLLTVKLWFYIAKDHKIHSQSRYFTFQWFVFQFLNEYTLSVTSAMMSAVTSIWPRINECVCYSRNIIFNFVTTCKKVEVKPRQFSIGSGQALLGHQKAVFKLLPHHETATEIQMSTSLRIPLAIQNFDMKSWIISVIWVITKSYYEIATKSHHVASGHWHRRSKTEKNISTSH